MNAVPGNRIRVKSLRLRLLPTFLIGAVLATALPAPAQVSLDALRSSTPAAGAAADGPVQVTAHVVASSDDRSLQLVVKAQIESGWHIYSLTQAAGGPVPTKITLEPSDQFKLTGEFESSTPPHISVEPAVFADLPIESHEEHVEFRAPLQVAPGVDPSSISISGKLLAQACNDRGCLPPTNYPFTAQLAAATGAPTANMASSQPSTAVDPATDTALGVWSEKGSLTTIRGVAQPAVVAPGETVRIVLSAEPDPGYHTYAWAPSEPESGTAKPALIALDGETDWSWSAPTADKPVVEKNIDGEVTRYHEGPVRWTIDVAVPEDAAPGEHVLSGLIGYQSCSDTSCDRPRAAMFDVAVAVGPVSQSGEIPLAFSKAAYRQAAQLSATVAPSAPTGSLDLANLQVSGTETSTNSPLWLMIVYGLIGGLALNLMPCVLPVIGLKVLAFVEQSGESRGRVFALNAWYSAGLISVFMVLAVLAVWANLAWGQQFSSLTFNIVMTCIVFAMGLSFLGVWELPIPGFATSSGAQDLARREGPLGAFAMGIVTTILATPCTGPFMSTALLWAMKQPPALTLTVFASIGLGMASPYLLIGAFPNLIRVLPRPGAWMETFKNLMGFLLLATVIYLLTIIASLDMASVLPTLSLLFGLWAACWWIGRTPMTADFGARVRAWSGAAAFSVLIWAVSFGWLDDVMTHRVNDFVTKRIARQLSGADENTVAAAEDELNWIPFTRTKLDELVVDNQTVLIDFTADWCPNCKLLESAVLNTKQTRDYVESRGIVAMKADITDFPEDATELLEALIGANPQIPVVAIFPAGKPNEPIVLNDMFSRSRLLEQLDKAGPSRPTAATASRPADDTTTGAQPDLAQVPEG